MLTVPEALDALIAQGDSGRAAGLADHHKVPRRYLGLTNDALNAVAQGWRQDLTLDMRLALAAGLWRSDIFEARLVAAKLLTQARIRPDDTAVWAMICGWLPDFDSWAIADAAMMAGQRRIMADLTRLDQVEAWTRDPVHWVRRAAMVGTLGLARLNHPDAAEQAARERVLGWAANFVRDPEWFIQKSVSGWLRDLSKHDPDRVRAFMAANGRAMKPFARREAEKHLAGAQTVTAQADASEADGGHGA